MDTFSSCFSNLVETLLCPRIVWIEFRQPLGLQENEILIVSHDHLNTIGIYLV